MEKEPNVLTKDRLAALDSESQAFPSQLLQAGTDTQSVDSDYLVFAEFEAEFDAEKARLDLRWQQRVERWRLAS